MDWTDLTSSQIIQILAGVLLAPPGLSVVAVERCDPDQQRAECSVLSGPSPGGSVKAGLSEYEELELQSTVTQPAATVLCEIEGPLVTDLSWT